MRVTVRLKPHARRDRIEGLAKEPGGGVALKVSVSAAPEDGKANAALILLLAREWRLPRRVLSLATGSRVRRKAITVAGDPVRLMQALEGWRANSLPRPPAEVRMA